MPFDSGVPNAHSSFNNNNENDFSSQDEKIILYLDLYCLPQGLLLTSAQSAEFHFQQHPNTER